MCFPIVYFFSGLTDIIRFEAFINQLPIRVY